jgi:hypothetical protein
MDYRSDLTRWQPRGAEVYQKGITIPINYRGHQQNPGKEGTA